MTSPVWLAAPVAETLAASMEAILPDRVAKRAARHDREFVVLSYKEDFDYLWHIASVGKQNLLEWISADAPKDKHVVVVWDGIPESAATTINIADYVTPFDWVIVCSKIIFSASADRSELANALQDFPALRISILDLQSQTHSGAFAYGAFSAVGNSLPWVQIYRPTQINRHEVSALLGTDNQSIAHLRSAVAPGDFGIETFFSDVLSSSEGSREATRLSLRTAQNEWDRSQIVKSLSSLWQGNLVRPGDRHHVGNLLAPVLLTKGLPSQLEQAAGENLLTNDSLHDALRVLVDVIGLERGSVTSKALVPTQGILRALKNESDVFDRRSNVKVLLIDDQFRLGYHDILSTVLFGTDYDRSNAITSDSSWRFEKPDIGSLFCEASAEPILSALEALPAVTDWSEPRFLPPSVVGDILVLDLRLWTDSKDRQRFLAKVIRICDKLGINPNKTSWNPLFDSAFRRAFDRAQLLARALDKETSEIEALTLFPLLLSYYDPSLPIILFSSTHQRSIVQMVSHRKNIISDFAKPILSGYGEEREPSESVDDLRRSLVAGIKLHEARGIWQRLIGFSWQKPPVFECSGWARGIKSLRVYNIPASATVNGSLLPTRTTSGNMQPRLDGRDMRVQLSKYFIEYLQGQRQFDFASIPWEMLEGTLLPKKVLSDPDIINPDFSIMPDLVVPYENRNLIARALELIRHKKAHGNAPFPQTESDKEEYRLGAMIQFSLLLDFIGAASTPEVPMKVTIDQLWWCIKRRNPHFFNINYALKPNRLSPGGRLTWLDFVAYTALWFATFAVDNGIRFLSTNTVNQIERMSQYVLSRP